MSDRSTLEVTFLLNLVHDEMIFLNEITAYMVIVFTKNEDCNALLPSKLKTKLIGNNTIQTITIKIYNDTYVINYNMMNNETGYYIVDNTMQANKKIVEDVLLKIMTKYPKHDIVDLDGNSYINKDAILTMIAMTGPILANLNMSKRLSFRLEYL